MTLRCWIPPEPDSAKKFLRGLPASGRGVLYLSCDPPTLARDLRAMRDEGRRVTRLQGYDMFPQTTHVETLVELTQAD